MLVLVPELVELPEKAGDGGVREFLSEFSEVLDVRSPGEYAADHLPGAINVPVLSDAEREEVGALYKADAFEGRRLGARLVTGNIERHLGAFFAEKGREYSPMVYCWRGGMRSRSLATVLSGVGWRSRVLVGGYKGWRRFVIDGLERLLEKGAEFRVLAGLTGVGKTRLLEELEKAGAQVLDLEGLAKHRGSILGNCGEQPSQRLYESKVFERLAAFDLEKPIFLEAESNRIGEVHVPSALWKTMGREWERSQVTEVKMSLEGRVHLLREEYTHFMEDEGGLLETLQPLRRLRGNAVIEGWETSIGRGDWDGFLRAILEEHYDVAYRTPGAEGSHYTEPKTTGNLGNRFEEGVGVLVEKLMSEG